MTARSARQQLARLLPLVLLTALAIVGLRGPVASPRWDGPLKAYGVIIGLVLEAVLGTLLVITFVRERDARRQHEQELAARSAVPGGPAARGGTDDDDERDVAGSLRFLLKLALGTAMAAIAVLLLLNLPLHLFTGKPRRLPVIHLLGPTATPTPALGRTGSGAHVSIPLAPIWYSLLVVALLAALAVSVWWARRLAKAVPLPAAAADEIAEDEEGLREAVASGRAAMADLDDARAAIIACYAAMEASLAERGTARGVAGTPSELLSRARDRGIVKGGAAGQLTALFYEARFSTHPLGARERAAAVAALDELSAELGDVASAAGSGSGAGAGAGS